MSVATTVTLGDFVTVVRQLAEAQPDFVYVNPAWRLDENDQPVRGGCEYLHGDEGGCIVGQAAITLGFTPEEMRNGVRGTHDDGRMRGGAQGFLEGLGLYSFGERDDDSRTKANWLRQVQLGQDEGKPWAEAVALADTIYPDVAA